MNTNYRPLISLVLFVTACGNSQSPSPNTGGGSANSGGSGSGQGGSSENSAGGQSAGGQNNGGQNNGGQNAGGSAGDAAGGGQSAGDGGSSNLGGSSLDCSRPDAGDAGPAEVTALKRVKFNWLPEYKNKRLRQGWITMEPKILRDRTPCSAGELFGFGAYTDDWGNHVMFKSKDFGETWAFVESTPATLIPDHNYYVAAAQDSSGKVHILNKYNPGGAVQYSRVKLVHNAAGEITGWTSDFPNGVNAYKLDGGYNTNFDIRGIIRVLRDKSGQETLVYAINDSPVQGGKLGFRIAMQKSKSLAPNKASDWTKMDGTAGYNNLLNSMAFTNHETNSAFHQIGSTKDIWLYYGTIDAECMAPNPAYGVRRFRLRASGDHAWTIGQEEELIGTPAGADQSPGLLDVQGTENYLWAMYIRPAEGVVIEKVAADGSSTQMPLVDGPGRHGWGLLSVSRDEKRVWAILNTIDRKGAVDCWNQNKHTRHAFWNGAAWSFCDDDPITGPSAGFGSISEWRDGIAAVYLNIKGLKNGLPENVIAVSSLRGGADGDVLQCE